MINIKRVKTLRNGAPYRNYCTDAGGDFPIHGAYWYAKLKTWYQISHTINGEYMMECQDGNDLVEGPVVEIPPELWKLLDPIYKYVAMDADGLWRAYTVCPQPTASVWSVKASVTCAGLGALVLPKVDPALWRETLVERPEGVKS